MERVQFSLRVARQLDAVRGRHDGAQAVDRDVVECLVRLAQ
jgi:hypothetical protein